MPSSPPSTPPLPPSAPPSPSPCPLVRPHPSRSLSLPTCSSMTHFCSAAERRRSRMRRDSVPSSTRFCASSARSGSTRRSTRLGLAGVGRLRVPTPERADAVLRKSAGRSACCLLFVLLRRRLS
ncbi:hypothetical protein FA09DRAFT_250137 [Tilletiopsis washingtonensis]|uniref:Uncharacterized protein n=1 Tax=Tilletiopsis washingtonensis TaxID=58919 RepID=A0A316ZAY3_9BASI|nr:hypothetical protein FA09DRAFT_250137 [Tilletiopsis washingtonensis]PWN98741.1 hypothetical protein FA09DRAFT_250137 [Tilletiopsis washingtonensis]